MWRCRVRTLLTVAGEIASVLNHLLRYPSAIGHRWAASPSVEPGSSGRPLVVLPGLADNTSIFSELKQALESCGVGPVVSFHYGWLTEDVRTAATRLAAEIERLCATTGATEVDIVGHSLGGLVGRYYVQCLAGHARVGTVV